MGGIDYLYFTAFLILYIQTINQYNYHYITINITKNITMTTPSLPLLPLPQIFHQVHTLITTLLQDITQLYSQNKLKHPVSHYEQTFIRLLLPVQLVCLFDRSECRGIVQGRGDLGLLVDQMGRIGVGDGVKYEKKKDQHKHQQSKINKIQDNPHQPLQPQPHQPTPPSISKPKPKPRTDTFNIHYKNGKPFIRFNVKSLGLQQKLKQWVVTEHEAGRLVGRIETIQMARTMGEHLQFRASAGWYSNFIKRNPEIRRLLTRGNKARGQYGMPIRKDDNIYEQDHERQPKVKIQEKKEA